MTVLARSSVLVLAVVAVALTCPTASSQTLLYTFEGDSPDDLFGHSVSGAGDVNMDGWPDFIVGAQLDDNNGVDSGSATVFSGFDGSVLWTWDGDSAGSEFSNRNQGVSGAGDVNGDGYADLIVGALLMGLQNRGKARVFSGKTGKKLYTFKGDSPNDHFGTSVSDAGDVNMDGFDDVIVGAPGDDNNGMDSGSATVFSGFDGSVIWSRNGDSPGDAFGWSVSGAGDVNMDGWPDFIVGALFDDNSGADTGMARVFSGKDGSILYTFDGDGPSGYFGWSVSGAGDVNGDGYADMIVGAPLDDNNGPNSGMARVFSGLDGSVLYTFDGDRSGISDAVFSGDQFGIEVSGAGDVNGDGYADLIVGIPLHDNNGTNSGGARVFSGVDGSVLYTFEGDVGVEGGGFGFGKGDYFGLSVSGVGDVNLDGFDDLIVGAVISDPNGPDSGSAQVFLSRPELGASYCSPAVNNSTGQPGVIRALGLDGAADNEVYLTVSQLPLSTVAKPLFGYFLVSQTQGLVMPPGSDGFLCLGGNIGRYRSHVRPGPTFSMQVDLTSIPVNPTQAVMAGDTWNFQAWYRDTGGSNNFTDAVSVLFK